MPILKGYDQVTLQSYTHPRTGETKLGEVVTTAEQFSENTRFVILGIPEDIGVRANYGIGGAHTAWPSFLEVFLNMQSTAGLSGADIGILGHLDCSDLMEASADLSIDQLREAVEIIDREVEQLIFEITASGKMPLVIGGGHNNAYPIIKGAARGYRSANRISAAKINVINLDAHTDFRPIEGRHSGNGFRYAFNEGFLDRYAVVGLHCNYNAQSVIDTMALEERIRYTFWEDIFLKEALTFRQAVDQAIAFTAKSSCGIELDLDCVENVLSSAMTPSGLSPTLTRQFLHWAGGQTDTAYLHICEGAIRLESDQEDDRTGKLIAYLVSDFLRANRK